MNYINRFELIQGLLNRKLPDSKHLLAGVDRKAVFKAVAKSKNGISRSFLITDEPIGDKDFAQMPQRDKNLLHKIFKRLPKSSATELPKLLKLKEQYPNIPCIYNYLAVIYAYTRQDQQYFEIVSQTREKFPNYLSGSFPGQSIPAFPWFF